MNPPQEKSSPPSHQAGERYEKSGCYPAQGRPFRLWALLGGLALVIVVLAAVSALLNFILL